MEGQPGRDLVEHACAHACSVPPRLPAPGRGGSAAPTRRPRGEGPGGTQEARSAPQDPHLWARWPQHRVCASHALAGGRGWGPPRTAWGPEGDGVTGAAGAEQRPSDARGCPGPRGGPGEPPPQEATEKMRPWGFLARNWGHRGRRDLGRRCWSSVSPLPAEEEQAGARPRAQRGAPPGMWGGPRVCRGRCARAGVGPSTEPDLAPRKWGPARGC